MPLPSGGWITIEGTEALTAVDVNSGSFTASTGLEETSLNVNLEAADEIGRQVRLRGVGGLIVVDFIHLSEPENIEKVLDVLEREPFQGSHADADLADVGVRSGRDHAQAHARSAGEADDANAAGPATAHGRKRTRDSVALEVLRRVERAGGRGTRQADRRACLAGGRALARRCMTMKCARALARRGRRARVVRGAGRIYAAKVSMSAPPPETAQNAPLCGKPQDAKFRPFCSKRCADLDLGRWLNGEYSIPGAPEPEGGAGRDDGENGA